MDSKMQDDEEYKRKIDDYRKELSSQLYASHREIDSCITIIATGSLVLSIGLLTDFNSLIDLWLVRLSWIFLLATMALQVFGHWLTVKGFKKQIEKVDQDDLESENPWNKHVGRTNIAIRVLLVLGVAFLSFYAFKNLHISTNDTTKETVVCQRK